MQDILAFDMSDIIFVHELPGLPFNNLSLVKLRFASGRPAGPPLPVTGAGTEFNAGPHPTPGVDFYAPLYPHTHFPK